jgi:glycosyltransferase involved in cell wall biosynthesis
MPELLNPSKILMITSYDFGGRYFRDIAHSFFENGEILTIMSLTASEKPKWTATTPIRDLTVRSKDSNLAVLRFIEELKVIKGFNPDVIQTHLFHAGIFGLFVGKFLKIPVVLTRHHIDEHYQSGTFVHRLIDRVVAKCADHVVVFSSAAKKWLIEIEGVKASQISVINQGFDFSSLNPSPEVIERTKVELNFSEDSLDIICVSRYSKAKGQDYLIYAISELVKTIPNISLTLMGPGDGGWLIKLVEDLDLGKHVKVLSERKDIPACIAAADMIIHPSLADSFSQLVIEAQAVGGLLIASDIAAVREQIVDGVTGLIVPPRNSTAIVEAVLFLVNNPELALSMRESGPLHVRNKFSSQRMFEEEIFCLQLFAK